MGKMVDKEALEFLRKMVKEGNIESRLKDSSDAVGRVAGVDFPKGIDPMQTEASIKRRVLEAMKRPAAMKAPAEEAMADSLEKMLKRAAGKSAGKTASILGPLGLLLSEGAEAAYAGESPEVEKVMLDRANAAIDPMETLRQKSLLRGEEVLKKQNTEENKEDVQNTRDMVRRIIDSQTTPEEKETKAEALYRLKNPESKRKISRDANLELNKMFLDKGLLK